MALQEVTRRTLPLWRAALAEAGLDALRERGRRSRRRSAAGRSACSPPRASRSQVLPAPPTSRGPSASSAARSRGVEVVNLHSPIAPAPDLAKVRTHEAVAAYLAADPRTPRILCGDLNTPRREHDDGSVLTFAHDSAGRLRPERGERWDAAERALVHTLRDEHGWVDAYRSLHGYGHREASWTFAQDRGGWRLDHVLVHGLEPVAASYAHEWRRQGLSDHSALVVDLVR